MISVPSLGAVEMGWKMLSRVMGDVGGLVPVPLHV
jgi:hypothetical protein